MDNRSTPSRGKQSQFQIPEYILVDLCSRFIINIPEEERHDLIRIFFQIELAHWFYLDFYCQDNSDLKAIGIKEFSAQIFYNCPTLSNHAGNVDRILESWREYKMAVPTYGAILLDPTVQYCLLVQGWTKASWGFPKGKVNEDEPPADCAVREVLEETGFDIRSLINKDEYIEYKMSEQLSRLYIVPGVSMNTKFMPRTRKEIKSLEWFRVEYLPAHKRDPICRQYYNLPANVFFMVIPFVKPLRKWVAKYTGVPESVESHTYRQRPRLESYNDRSSSGPRQRRESTSHEGRSQSGGGGGSHDKAGKYRQQQKQQFMQNTKKDYQEFIELRKYRGGSAGREGSAGGGGGHFDPSHTHQQPSYSRGRADASPHVKAGGPAGGMGHSQHPHSGAGTGGKQFLQQHQQQQQASRSPKPGSSKKPDHRLQDKPVQIMRRDASSKNQQANTRRSLAIQFTEGGKERTSPSRQRKARKDLGQDSNRQKSELFNAPSWTNFHFDSKAILSELFQ